MIQSDRYSVLSLNFALHNNGHIVMRCFIGVLCCPLPVYTMLYIATLNYCVLDTYARAKRSCPH